MTWPVAQLDPVRRLHVMAEVLAGVGIAERVMDVPFDHLWATFADMEHSVPTFDPLVASLRIVERDGPWLVVRSTPPGVPIPTWFDVELRPGWCWMQSSSYVVGVAARPEGDRTRCAMLEGLPWRHAPRLLRPIQRRLVGIDVAGLERLALSRTRD